MRCYAFCQTVFCHHQRQGLRLTTRHMSEKSSLYNIVTSLATPQGLEHMNDLENSVICRNENLQSYIQSLKDAKEVASRSLCLQVDRITNRTQEFLCSKAIKRVDYMKSGKTSSVRVVLHFL